MKIVEPGAGKVDRLQAQGVSGAPSRKSAGRRRPGSPLRSLGGKVAALAAILGIWQLAAQALHKPFLPGPGPCLAQMAVRLADGSLGIHLGASAYRVGAALLVSGPAGFALGLAAGRIRGLDRVLSPFVYVFHPLPKVAFLPVIMLLAGLGDSAKIILICLVILGQLYLGARDAAREVSPAAMDSVRSLGAGPLDLLHHVILPASLPALLSSLRVALGTAVAILFFSESFASDRGMGYFIMDAWSRVDYRDMYGGVAALSLATLLVYAALDGIELLICPWKRPLDW